MTEFAFVRYHGSDGSVHAVAKRGRKYFTLVWFEYPITTHRLELSEEEHMYPTPGTMRAAIVYLRGAAGRCGITEGAKKLLEDAEASL